MVQIRNCPICNGNLFKNHINSIDYSVTKEEFNIVRCNSCDFHFTNPRPDNNELGRYYISDHYISHNNTNKTLFEKAYQTVRKITIKGKFKLIKQYTNKGSILDIGCGTGEFLNIFKKNGWTTKGIEPNGNARQKAIKNHKLDVIENTNLSDIEDKFDIISMWHVLEHVTDLKNNLNELNRLLSKNGKIIIAVPNLNSYDSSYYGQYWAAYDLPIHLSHFSKKTITKLFRNNGFSLVKTKGMKFDSFYVSIISEEHKTGKKNYIKAILIGFISNLYGWLSKKGYSSSVYVFEKHK